MHTSIQYQAGMKAQKNFDMFLEKYEMFYPMNLIEYGGFVTNL